MCPSTAIGWPSCLCKPPPTPRRSPLVWARARDSRGWHGPASGDPESRERDCPRSHVSRFFSQRFAGCCCHFLDYGDNGFHVGRLIRKLSQRLGHKQHFVSIADHSLPAEIANAIHNLRGTGSTVGQVAAV